MKIWFWLLLLALLGLGLYVYLNPHARKELQQFSGGLTEKLTGNAAKTARMYQWRNAAGEWQITDFPPAEGIPFETREYRSDENVLPLPPQLQAP